MRSSIFALVISTIAVAQPANDTCANATVIPATKRGRSQVSSTFGAAAAPEAPMSCAPAAQSSVWYAFTPSESGRYEFSSCPNRGALATSFKNFSMAVYSGTCTALAEVSNGCNDDWCGQQPRVAVELHAGVTYRIQLAHFDAAAETGDTVQLAVTRASGADNCAGNIPELPMNTTLTVSTVEGEVNDSQITPACYSGLNNITTTPQSEGPRRDRVHRFTAPNTGAFSFRVGASGRAYDSVLYLTNTCETTTTPNIYSGPQCIAAANRLQGSSTAQEEVSCVTLNAGQQVYVWVDEGLEQNPPLAGGTMSLEVTSCQREVEPNDTPALASPLSCNLTGSIQTAGDVDFFSLGTPTNGSRVFAMAETSTALGTGTSAQLHMRVTTSTNTIEFDTADLDSEFGGTSPGIAGTPLTNVPHFLRVAHDNSSGSLQPYHLWAVIQPGAATPEIEPNDSLLTATVGATNYFAGTTAAPSDVDFFAFQARAGDVVYLALDSVPARNAGATANHSLALWNEAGQQIYVNDGNVTVNVNPSDGTLTSVLPVVPSEHLLFRIPENGTYRARVTREHPTNPNADYLLSISINCGIGGGLDAPSLTSLSPSSGSALGGEVVTLTGTGFGPGSVVKFASAEAEVTSVTSTQLVVRTPVGTDGPTNVTVTNFGHAATSGTFTYVTPQLPPTVSSVTPSAGTSAGGQVITVRGQLFQSGATVSFTIAGDTRAGTNVNVVNLTELTVTTPAHVDGNATVTVTNTSNQSGSLPNAFRFNAPPTLTSLTPSTGLTSGNATITLNGTNFRTGALVRFGIAAGTNVNVDPSGHWLTTTVPANATPGLVDVIVANPDGQEARRVDGFRYLLPTPAVTNVSPARGPSGGGTLITITGAEFFTSPTVLVNQTPASNVTRLSATQLTAVTPPGTPGVVNVTVANFDGQQATLVAAFAYDAAPTVSSVTPARGPVSGNTRITIHGADFQPGALVHIGGSPSLATTVVNSTTLTTTTPSGIAGAANVEVTNVDSQRGSLTGAFTYDAAPVLTSLSPTTGSTSGGTVVTLSGSNFANGAEVIFGTVSSSTVNVISSTQMTAVAPAAAKNVIAVTVRNTDGQSSTLSDVFRYVDASTVTSLTPNAGTAGTVVRITGENFTANSTVRFGTDIANVTFINPTTLDAIAPNGSGTVDVHVDEATLTNAFTYARATFSVIAISPNSGSVKGGNEVNITGTGFASNTTVSLGTLTSTTADTLKLTMPPHAVGIVTITVKNDADSATVDYRYVDDSSGPIVIEETPNPTPSKPPTGCGCSSVEGSTLMFAALSLLLRRRNQRPPSALAASCHAR